MRKVVALLQSLHQHFSLAQLVPISNFPCSTWNSKQDLKGFKEGSSIAWLGGMNPTNATAHSLFLLVYILSLWAHKCFSWRHQDFPCAACYGRKMAIAFSLSWVAFWKPKVFVVINHSLCKNLKNVFIWVKMSNERRRSKSAQFPDCWPQAQELVKILEVMLFWMRSFTNWCIYANETPASSHAQPTCCPPLFRDTVDHGRICGRCITLLLNSSKKLSLCTLKTRIVRLQMLRTLEYDLSLYSNLQVPGH